MRMRFRGVVVICLFLFVVQAGYCLEPEEILVIANSDVAESIWIARYYCAKRKVAADNIFALSLGVELSDTISRCDYEKKLAGPIREKLSSGEFAGKIKCLLTTPNPTKTDHIFYTKTAFHPSSDNQNLYTQALLAHFSPLSSLYRQARKLSQLPARQAGKP